jgi:hypothetical protein
MKALILLLLLSTSLFAKEYSQQFSYKEFYSAKTSNSYLRFDMKSTKLGMLTTDFFGVAKKFNISFDKTGDMIDRASVNFKILDLDTDVNDRNKKMYNLCFDYKKYPELTITLNKPIKINSEVIIPAIILIRGKKKTINLKVKVTQKENKLIVSGISKVSLKALEVPDPSIWIAKVDDSFNLNFSVELDL